MTKRTRCTHSSTFKAKVAVVPLKGDKTLAGLAQPFDARPNQITDWKNQLLKGAVDIFGGACCSQPPAVDLKALHAKIGQLALENDFL